MKKLIVALLLFCSLTFAQEQNLDETFDTSYTDSVVEKTLDSRSQESKSVLPEISQNKVIIAADGVPLSSIEISGDLAFTMGVKQKPSSKRNFSDFDDSKLELNFDAEMEKNGLLHLGFGLFTLDSGAKTFGFEQGYYEFGKFLYENGFIRFGLIPNEYKSFFSDVWVDVGGRGGQSLAERFSYLKKSDYGFDIGGKINLGWSRWALSVVNGEGYDSKEQGPRKDVSLFLELRPSSDNGKKPSHYFLALYAHEGSYEFIEPKKNYRERGVLSLGYSNPDHFSFAIEGFASRDAVDGVQVLPSEHAIIADGIDLSSRGGELVEGRGASALLYWNLGWIHNSFKKLGYLAKYDKLTPDKLRDKLQIVNVVQGFEYVLAEKFRISLVRELSEHSEELSKNVIDYDLDQYLLSFRGEF